MAHFPILVNTFRKKYSFVTTLSGKMFDFAPQSTGTLRSPAPTTARDWGETGEGSDTRLTIRKIHGLQVCGGQN
jgi:hypothetical protein